MVTDGTVCLVSFVIIVFKETGATRVAIHKARQNQLVGITWFMLAYLQQAKPAKVIAIQGVLNELTIHNCRLSIYLASKPHCS